MSSADLVKNRPFLRVRQRAAALITQSGRVLLHQLDGDTFWALPGGAIEPGESAAQAVARELHEELGGDLGAPFFVGALAVVAENFFSYAGVAYHEIGLYLHASPLPGNPLVLTEGPYDGAEGSRRLTFAWFTGDEVDHLDIRPAFLREYLCGLLVQGPKDVLHIVHRDEPLPTDAVG
ncbi:MAG: NUDIX hydrolase [Acidovorax sp.]|uniref:NUDIX hydrolase n=1 Tax=Acidovorax sp. TaxID=1872122 RepID=UPI00391DFB6C